MEDGQEDEKLKKKFTAHYCSLLLITAHYCSLLLITAHILLAAKFLT